MCIEVFNKLDEVVAVRYWDATADYTLSATVYQHRGRMDEYQSVTGVTLDECKIDSDDESIIEYLQ